MATGGRLPGLWLSNSRARMLEGLIPGQDHAYHRSARGTQEERAMMRVADILRGKGAKGSDVIQIDEQRTVHDAICTLNEHGIGALVVTGEDGEISGIITERDILREYGKGCDASGAAPDREGTGVAARVRDVMTTRLIIGVPDDDLNYVMSVMTKNRIRHLPIVDGKELIFMAMDDKEVHPTYDIGIWVNTPFFAGALENLFNIAWKNMKPAK